MVKDKFVTYKVYRLIDQLYPPMHENYVRYIGVTYKNLKRRLLEHRSHARRVVDDPRLDWFRVGNPEIQLVESIDTRSKAKSREGYWVELHQKAGYNLLNISLMQGVIFPRKFKDPTEIRKEIESRIEDTVLHTALVGYKHRYREWLISTRDSVEEG